MQGDILGANPTAFTAVCAAACHMECTDNMEQILLEGVRGSFVAQSGLIIVKHTLFAAAGGAYIPACIATNAAGKFPSPKLKTLLRSHRL
jgi:hypothetical protein